MKIYFYIKNHVYKLRDFFIEFIFPIECICCGKDNVWICHQCFSKLEYNKNQSCLSCKTVNDFGKFCDNCKNNFDIDGILIAANYQNKLISNLIKILKYKFSKDLANDLGYFQANFIKNKLSEKNKPQFFNNLNNVILAPVPLHKKRLKWRGFNQAEELANKISRELNIPINKCLKRIKYKKPQAKLNAQQRKNNILGCFNWEGNHLDNKNILLVDDVTTTGSTLNECAKILKQNGANQIWGLVIANG